MSSRIAFALPDELESLELVVHKLARSTMARAAQQLDETDKSLERLPTILVQQELMTAWYLEKRGVSRSRFAHRRRPPQETRPGLCRPLSELSPG